MKKLKIYPDTTIFNFVFADGDPEKREIAVKFFDDMPSITDCKTQDESLWLME